MNDLKRTASLILEKMEYQIRLPIARDCLHNLRVEVKEQEVLAETVADRLMIYLTGVFIKGSTDVMATEEVPVTWWDAVKDRFLPGFLRRFVPVQMRTIETTLRADFFPNIRTEDLLAAMDGSPGRVIFRDLHKSPGVWNPQDEGGTGRECNGPDRG